GAAMDHVIANVSAGPALAAEMQASPTRAADRARQSRRSMPLLSPSRAAPPDSAAALDCRSILRRAIGGVQPPVGAATDPWQHGACLGWTCADRDPHLVTVDRDHSVTWLGRHRGPAWCGASKSR